MTPANVTKIRKHKAHGKTVAEVVKLTDISRERVYRALAE